MLCLPVTQNKHMAIKPVMYFLSLQMSAGELNLFRISKCLLFVPLLGYQKMGSIF